MRESTGLYIHIPFCFSRCGYCAFYSTSHVSVSLIEEYSAAITEEVSRIMRERKSPFTTVYIGGGNPGMIPIDHLISLADMLTAKGEVKEFTIEMNPENVNEPILPLFDHGINRLSVGIQSLDERHLKTLERSASLSATYKALKWMRYLSQQKSVAITADLMTCIPFQKVSDTMHDIDMLLSELSLQHLSLYNLTWEEGTSLVSSKEKGKLSPYEGEKERDILETLWAYLEEKGLHQYEISNFSTSRETRSRHNQLYWTDGRYEAVGASAAGVIDTTEKTIRKTGLPDVHAYLSASIENRYTTEELSLTDRCSEYILSALRTADGISISYLEEIFNLTFSSAFERPLKLLEQQFPTHFSYTPQEFALTQEGFMLCDSITSLFLKEL